MTHDPALATKLDALLAAIRRYDDPRRAAAEWKQAYTLLQRAGLPWDLVSGVVGMRDADGLAELLHELHNPAATPSPADAPPPELCAKALQAFLKRMALTALDDESKLGRNPLTKGAESSVAGIVPPAEWPAAVWQELVRQGHLRYIGHGCYQPAKPRGVSPG